MNAFIPSDSVVFQMAAPRDDARFTVGSEEWKVVRHVDSVRDVREIVEATGLSRARVVGALFALGEAGFLEKVDLQRRLRAQGPRAFSSFSLLAPDGRTPEAVELEEKLRDEWRKAPRFGGGVLRVELRTLGYKKGATMSAVFRSGLGRDLHLPRPLLQGLGVREGDDLLVRPVA
jgi:DNA-binding transcriptional ArsR family regulator